MYLISPKVVVRETGGLKRAVLSTLLIGGISEYCGGFVFAWLLELPLDPSFWSLLLLRLLRSRSAAFVASCAPDDMSPFNDAWAEGDIMETGGVGVEGATVLATDDVV